MLLNHTLLNNSILHPNHATHNTRFWNYHWYIWTYSKVFKSTKTDIFNIQLVRIYKTTYIFCNSIIYKNNNFLVSRISPWLHRTHDSNISPIFKLLEPNIGELIEVANPNTCLQTFMTLDYANEPIFYDTYKLPTYTHVALPASKTS
jgi:hypothetical protein